MWPIDERWQCTEINAHGAGIQHAYSVASSKESIVVITTGGVHCPVGLVRDAIGLTDLDRCSVRTFEHEILHGSV